MSLILTFFSSFILSIANAQSDDVQNAAMARATADFQVQKSAALQTFGCKVNRDEPCKRIEASTSTGGLWLAVGEKRDSDQKILMDRINVLECCLGVDSKNSCDGLSKKNQRDVEDCRKKIKEEAKKK